MLDIGLIGGGNLAQALLAGLTGGEKPVARVTLWEIDKAKAGRVTAKFSITEAASLAEAAAHDILFLAVKPQAMPELLARLAGLVRPGQLVITVAAGLPLKLYAGKLPQAVLVRAMPNTSAKVLRSITGLMSNSELSPEHRKAAERIFSAVGSFIWLPEENVHALTALSGSGPAYVYYLAETMAAAGKALGLDEKTAGILAKETLIGAGRMLDSSDEEPSELRHKVTSPGGTTAAALNVLQSELPDLLVRALTAADARSREMAGE